MTYYTLFSTDCQIFRYTILLNYSASSAAYRAQKIVYIGAYRVAFFFFQIAKGVGQVIILLGQRF